MPAAVIKQINLLEARLGVQGFINAVKMALELKEE